MSGWSGKNYIIETILIFPNILITRIQTHLKKQIWVKYSEVDLLNYLGLYPSFKTKANSSLCVYTLQKKTFCRCIRTFFCHTSTKDGEEMQQKV